MKQTASEHGPHPDLIAGIAIIVVAGFLLLRTPDMPTMSSILPITMLSALIGFAALMILRVFVANRSERVKAPRHRTFDSWPRFLGIITSIGIYVVSVSLIGFYTTTAVMVPVVAWCFGYRNIKRLLLADLIFTGGLAVIFVLMMGQDLPTEFFIR
ncbi:tripartite tricarboxylate transporter TctB family protein [Billgrantia lactosivorans]|uniref:tripartite tricarboxylate transporter TctB family protein n=1 Tax=Billgrantia lactosivorans TaxID=2185141 RepID=UPI0013A6890A|nr:tripartite tricarboxylate transporter TctB family protein [Halomonas lactosivorans]